MVEHEVAHRHPLHVHVAQCARRDRSAPDEIYYR
jgi:hypothetical protein